MATSVSANGKDSLPMEVKWIKNVSHHLSFWTFFFRFASAPHIVCKSSGTTRMPRKCFPGPGPLDISNYGFLLFLNGMWCQPVLLISIAWVTSYLQLNSNSVKNDSYILCPSFCSAIVTGYIQFLSSSICAHIKCTYHIHNWTWQHEYIAGRNDPSDLSAQHLSRVKVPQKLILFWQDVSMF